MGRCAAPTACAAAAGSTSNISANSCTVGTLPSFAVKSAVAFVAFKDNSFKARPTFTAPPSLNKRFISPKMTGTAYVENFTPLSSSNPSTAFTKPRHPAWNRSSYSIPRDLNRLAQAWTKPILSLIFCSRLSIGTLCLFAFNLFL